MNRRLVLASVLAVAICGSAAPALASGAEPRREKLCVTQPTVVPEGFCITWIDPAGPAR